MKKCPNCNQEVSNGIQVCPNCGEFIDGNQTSKQQDNSKKNDIEEMPEENYPEEELKKQQKDERSDFGRTDNDK
ncbi:hypothetical protein LNK15_00435 [Jeotgalicoccus huakuii]|nr:hypothetical protein [Jeotgalicoccus huakuii]